MSETAGLPGRAEDSARPLVTDPVRVFLVDLNTAAASALGRAIDIDRELAVVGICRDLRRVRRDADHCRPDIIAIRLDVDDAHCVKVLGDLVDIDGQPCVVVLGVAKASASERAVEASLHKARIRSVAEANFGIAAEPASLPRASTGAVLH